ncbi:class I SAM-dependent methyltransferase [Nocardiopsis sp. NPDC058631]|uniref:class I SAM-dependent methyltransferase n=1 Tax=Nocardiopsis sp. NPDC058631 TaxID=3346566 RepID=UPI003669A163
MRSLRSLLRPLLVIGAVAGAAVLAVPVALGALGLIGWVDAAALVLLGALGGAVFVLALGLLLLRRTVNRLATSVSTVMDTHSRRVAETLGRDRLEAARSMDGVKERLTHLRDHSLPKLTREVTHAITVQGRNDYEQQVAWTELREHLGTPTFMPPLRGWAASPDVMRLLVREIDRRRPELVVECGSGSSSVWIGYALRRAGGGRLVAVEHDARYAELSRALVASHGLEDVVEVRTAPLTEFTSGGEEPEDGAEGAGGGPRQWYDTSVLADLEGIGLLFVDGPPEATGAQARYPAVPALLPHCSEDVVIILDDASRTDERALGDRWLAENPALRRTEEAAEKGAHVFTRS